MNDKELISAISTSLSQVLAKNNINLTRSFFDPVRHYAAATWENPELAIEVYSDPMSGEINCRIKKHDENGEKEKWVYIYEEFPMTAEEIKKAHTSVRSEKKQLDGIIDKLKLLLMRNENCGY